ncbi:MAG: C40 family peptidase [Bacteroidota bacterium]
MEGGDKGICRLSIVPVRMEPSDRSEQVTQLLFGEHYLVIDRSKDNKWLMIKTAFDDYTGWISSNQNHFIGQEYFEQISDLDYKITTDINSEILFNKNHLRIVIGSIIPISSQELFRMEEQFSFRGNAKGLAQKKDYLFLKEIAKKYLHTPYQWGGRTPFGIDCSGFIQQIFRISGYNLPRDAWQQSKLGKSIDFEDLRPGDLAFFATKDNRINHVGLLLEERKIIHASGHVRIDSLDEKGIFNNSINNYTHQFQGLKRILRYTHGQ